MSWEDDKVHHPFSLAYWGQPCCITLRSRRSLLQLNERITRVTACMQTHIPFNFFLPHLLPDLDDANQPRTTWQRWHEVLEVTLRETVCRTNCGWMAYRFMMPKWRPRPVTANVCSGTTKWINQVVFLISITATQIRKHLQRCWRGAACLHRTIDAVFWSSFVKSSLQLTPLEPSSYSTERACEHMRNRAAQKRAGTAAHSPAFTAAPFENTPLVSCPTLHFYFLLEHGGMFLSTVVTHFINNWLCQPLMNKSSRGKRKHEFFKYFFILFLVFFCCSDSYTWSLPLLTLNFPMMNYNTLTRAQVHKSLTLFEMEIHPLFTVPAEDSRGDWRLLFACVHGRCPSSGNRRL